LIFSASVLNPAPTIPVKGDQKYTKYQKLYKACQTTGRLDRNQPARDLALSLCSMPQP